MADRKRRRKPNPAARANAVNFTIYDPAGGPVHESVLTHLQQAVQRTLEEERLVVTVSRN
jgi:hypothetical protein